MLSEKTASTFQSFGNAHFFVFCDHASNHVPADLNCLGLSEDILETHIAWDIGSHRVAEKLARNLNGALFTCQFSRLVIDANRAENAPDLIPAASDQIPIPGNQMLTADDKQHRIERFHAPYHAAIQDALNETMARHEPFVISVHSYTRRLIGAAEDRPWIVGFLWREDETSAKKMMIDLRAHTDWTIGDNEPYDAREFNYTVDRHIGPRGLRHITLEIRQDCIANDADAEHIATILTESILRIA